MSRFIEKLRKDADYHFNHEYGLYPTWRSAILESIFKPKAKVPGKEPMSHLHPDIDKLHLPENVYIADWRKYRVEDHPALMNFQKRCHAAGLHDPWLRNYAFMFYPNNLVKRSRMALITYGCGFGFVTGGIIFLTEKIYHHFYPPTYAHTPEYIAKYGTAERHH